MDYVACEKRFGVDGSTLRGRLSTGEGGDKNDEKGLYTAGNGDLQPKGTGGHDRIGCLFRGILLYVS